MSEERGHIVRRTGRLVATGSLVDGFDFYGPFDTAEAAAGWAGAHLLHTDWHLVPVKLVESPDGR